MTFYMDTLEELDGLCRTCGCNLQDRSRTASLQVRLQEVRERERKAQLLNRQLLLDFQRAEDTLDDLVARTEAMNTVRMEYEKYLEENLPFWQQRLKDRKLAAQRERVKLHLKDYIERMVKERVMEKDDSNRTVLFHPPFSTASGLPHPHIAKNTPHSSLHPHESGQGGPTQVHGYNQGNVQGYNIRNGPHIPPHHADTWLPQAQAPLKTTQDNRVYKETTRSFQKSSESSPPSPHYPPATNIVNNPYSTVQPCTSIMEEPRQYQYVCADKGTMLTPRAQRTPNDDPYTIATPTIWGMMPVPDPTELGWGTSEVEEDREERSETDSSSPQDEGGKSQEHKRKGQKGERSCELDTQPVRLSTDQEGSSESSSEVCVVGTTLSPWRKRTDGEGEAPTYGPEATASPSSSIVSEESTAANWRAQAPSTSLSGSQSEARSKSSKKSQGSSGKRIMQVNGNDAKGWLEKTDRRDERKGEEAEEGSEEGEQSISSGDDKEEQGIEESKSGGEDEDEIGLDGEVQGEDGDEESEEVSDEEAQGEETDEHSEEVSEGYQRGCERKENKQKGEEGNDTSGEDGGDVASEESMNSTEEGASEGTDEGEDRKMTNEKERSVKEIRKEARNKKEGKQRSANTPAKGESEKKRDERMNGEEEEQSDNMEEKEDDDDRAASAEEIHDSLREIYESEEDEIEDDHEEEDNDNDDDDDGSDAEEDEDDDDDVVVDKGYPWSTKPSSSHTKYHDVDYNSDEDIESLVAPQQKLSHKQEEEPELRVKPKDRMSDSEETEAGRLEVVHPEEQSVDSDNEFDSFYD